MVWFCEIMSIIQKTINKTSKNFLTMTHGRFNYFVWDACGLMCMHMWICMNVHAYIWRSKVNFRGPSTGTIYCVFWGGVSCYLETLRTSYAGSRWAPENILSLRSQRWGFNVNSEDWAQAFMPILQAFCWLKHLPSPVKSQWLSQNLLIPLPLL